MFENYALIADRKPDKGYYQVITMLNDVHEANSVFELKEWESDAFPTIRTSLVKAQEEAEVILRRTAGGKIVEAVNEKEDDADEDEMSLPGIVVVDAKEDFVAILSVEFHDYSNETIQ